MLDVDGLIARRVPVKAGRRGGGNKRYAYVIVGEQQAPAEHQVAPGGQAGGAHVPRQQRMVRHRPGLPAVVQALALHDRGRGMDVVEKGGIRGETLLTHKLF
jgi:hypothetical protein